MPTKDDFRFVVYTKNNGEKTVYVQERGLLWGWNYVHEDRPTNLPFERVRHRFNSLEGAGAWLEALLGDQVNEELTTYFYPSSQKFSKT